MDNEKTNTKLSLPVNTEGVRTFVTKTFRFSASHNLPDHDGICKAIHEHEYRLKITLSGPVKKGGPEAGMLFDFARLEIVVQREIITLMMAKFLPDLFNFPTTVENLALWIGHALNDHIDGMQTNATVWVKSVTLYEDESSYATVKFPSPY